MYSKAIKEIQTLLNLINNQQLSEYVAQMCADFINKEMKGQWTQQDVLQALEATFLGIQKRYEDTNK